MNSVQWPDDLMQRRDSGDFLYKLIQSKYESYIASNKKASLTFALDGDWGTGKSFFIERWSEDIKNGEHVVIHFDAWTNDLSDDPLLGFMAEIKNSLSPLAKQIPKLSPQSKKKITDQTIKFLKQAAKAIGPATLTAGKAIATHYISKEGVEALSDIVNDENQEKTTDLDTKQISEKTLEKYFEEALKNHTNQKNAITQLITDLEQLTTYLKESNTVNLPIYIFIDELDRCRPSYAIRLLEGLKHLFNAQGVCFVVSTNLIQLSESVKSVYGQGFDGYRYLKRFFDFEYKLPAPNNLAHSEYLFQESPLRNRKKLEPGIHEYHSQRRMQELPVATVFSDIATAFNLDLRSQKQVFAQAVGAISSIPETETVHCAYIFALAACAHISPTGIDKLIDHSDSKIVVQNFKNKEYRIPFYNSSGDLVKKTVTLDSIISFYHEKSNKPIPEISNSAELKDGQFLGEILRSLINESRPMEYTITKKYASLIRLAGNLSTQEHR
ncbi:KAP family P-loop NTPase fold protein [Acidovorax radicis]|uniref:KAP family P-loop NTPase fold protein n=1 Tax=Acidovorax radicis TaxID=758826 RepID=UPI00030FA08E|nr:P-loop NTPase fold protein [Acidovorax radicis]